MRTLTGDVTGMELSLLLLNQTLVMALMVVAGVIAAKTGLVSMDENRVISRVTLYVITPCAIVSGFQTEMEAEKMEGMLAALVAAVCLLGAMIAAGHLMGKGRHGLTRAEQAAAIYSNAGNLIIPIVTAVLGEEYVIYACVYMTLQAVLLWSHGRALVTQKGKMDVKAMFLNPCFIGTAIGTVMFFGRIQLPSVLYGAVSGLGNCLGPVSMLSIGVMLVNADLKEAFTSLRMWRVIALRLLIFPVLSVVLLKILVMLWPGSDISGVLTVSLLGAIGPTAVTVTQLAQLADSPESGSLSSVNAVTTVLCALTMPATVYLYLAVV